MGRRWLRPGAIWAPSRVWDSPRRWGSSIAWRSTRGGPGAGTAASPRTPRGGWGGAHPFAVLDYSVVHNGEISSYGINRRYLEMFGYRCTLRTDTEVVTYLFDLMLRRHGLPVEMACRALASPFWEDIDRMPEEEKELYTALRMVYGSALLNGPFAIVLGMAEGMVALNDRIKLRPLVAARDGSRVFVASEESAIREICAKLDAAGGRAGSGQVEEASGVDPGSRAEE